MKAAIATTTPTTRKPTTHSMRRTLCGAVERADGRHRLRKRGERNEDQSNADDDEQREGHAGEGLHRHDFRKRDLGVDSRRGGDRPPGSDHVDCDVRPARWRVDLPEATTRADGSSASE